MAVQREDSSTLSDKNFNFLCRFAYESAGIVLNASKREMLYRRLTRILRDRKLTSFSQYCELLKAEPELEASYFINAITTNLTSFFREPHHFEFLKEKTLPDFIKKAKSSREHQDKKLRIWSCASSTGEEPYSIAMTVLDAFSKQLMGWDVKILASDIDSDVLSVAKQGIYEEKRIEGLSLSHKKNYFHRGKGIHSSKVKVDETLQKLITFKQLNLLHEWPMNGPFDIIFCRNVIIYFDKNMQQDLFERFYDLLKPGGLLVLGHSENLGAYQKYYENLSRTIFRKPLS